MNEKIKLHTEVTIDSCHQLNGYDGKCKNLHGHTWKIELWFKGYKSLKDEVGILVDFSIVKQLKNELCHKNLNEVTGINPTAENLSEWIYNYIKNNIQPEIDVKVRLYETAVDKLTWTEYGDFE